MRDYIWKLITLCASVTIAYSIESAVWSPTCSPSSESTVIPHPGDCRKFFVCLQGIAYPLSCPYGLNWNPSLKKCTTLVACGSEQYIRVPKYNPLCPLDEDPSNPTHLPDANDCGKFYECQGGFSFHMVCPDGQHWSVERESCEEASVANCKPSQTAVGNGQVNAACPSTDDPNNPTHLPHPDDCTKFYKCAFGRSYILSCLFGMHWDVDSNRCESPFIAKCGKTKITTLSPTTSLKTTTKTVTSFQPTSTAKPSPNEPICPSDGVKNFGIPGLCDIYFSCSEGKLYVMACRKGHEWSDRASACVQADLAECISSGSPIISTTNPTGAVSPPTSTTAGPSTNLPICPSDGIKNFGIPGQCDKYFSCSQGKLYIVACRQGREWSDRVRACVHADLAECTGISSGSPIISTKTPTAAVSQPTSTTARPSTNLPICPSDGIKNFGIPGQCDKYFSCSQGKLYVIACREGREWSEAVSGCVHASLAECTGINGGSRKTASTVKAYTSMTASPSSGQPSLSITRPTACNPGVAFLSHPTDCHKYFMCSNGKPVEMSCPARLFFSYSTQSCQWTDIDC